eukprot:3900340-Lingulodinium_polyedra.AAC.1
MHLAAAPQLVMLALTSLSAVGAGPGWEASPMRRTSRPGGSRPAALPPRSPRSAARCSGASRRRPS